MEDSSELEDVPDVKEEEGKDFDLEEEEDVSDLDDWKDPPPFTKKRKRETIPEDSTEDHPSSSAAITQHASVNASNNNKCSETPRPTTGVRKKYPAEIEAPTWDQRFKEVYGKKKSTDLWKKIKPHLLFKYQRHNQSWDGVKITCCGEVSVRSGTGFCRLSKLHQAHETKLEKKRVLTRESYKEAEAAGTLKVTISGKRVNTASTAFDENGKEYKVYANSKRISVESYQKGIKNRCKRLRELPAGHPTKIKNLTNSKEYKSVQNTLPCGYSARYGATIRHMRVFHGDGKELSVSDQKEISPIHPCAEKFPEMPLSELEMMPRFQKFQAHMLNYHDYHRQKVKRYMSICYAALAVKGMGTRPVTDLLDVLSEDEIIKELYLGKRSFFQNVKLNTNCFELMNPEEAKQLLPSPFHFDTSYPAHQHSSLGAKLRDNYRVIHIYSWVVDDDETKNVENSEMLEQWLQIVTFSNSLQENCWLKTINMKIERASGGSGKGLTKADMAAATTLGVWKGLLTKDGKKYELPEEKYQYPNRKYCWSTIVINLSNITELFLVNRKEGK